MYAAYFASRSCSGKIVFFVFSQKFPYFEEYQSHIHTPVDEPCLAGTLMASLSSLFPSSPLQTELAMAEEFEIFEFRKRTTNNHRRVSSAIDLLISK